MEQQIVDVALKNEYITFPNLCLQMRVVVPWSPHTHFFKAFCEGFSFSLYPTHLHSLLPSFPLSSNIHMDIPEGAQSCLLTAFFFFFFFQCSVATGVMTKYYLKAIC